MAFKQGRLQTAITWLLLFLLLPLYTYAAVCRASDIQQVSVGSCTCASSFPNTNCNQCPAICGGSPNDKLRMCSEGCTDNNINCSACDIYFENLCGCLQDKKCYHTQNTDPWTLLHKGTLITTPHLIRGILEVGSDNRGWQLGQDTLLNKITSSRAYGTLAMNSVLARTKEQVHIHVCDQLKSALRGNLNNLYKSSPSAYKSLTAMPFSVGGFAPGKIHCQASQTKGNNQFPMADLVRSYLSSLGSCDDRVHVGAGLITDSNDYTWGCVTDGGSAEDLFC